MGGVFRGVLLLSVISFNACSVDIELIEDNAMGILLWLEQTLIL